MLVAIKFDLSNAVTDHAIVHNATSASSDKTSTAFQFFDALYVSKSLKDA